MPALRRGRLGLAVAGAATLSLITTTAASAAVITSEDAVALGGAMSAVGVTGGAFTVDYDCSGVECPTGIADSAMAGFPTSGPTFGIITSEDAGLADDPNSEGGSGSAGPAGYADPWQRLGPAGAQVDLPAASGNCLAFDFRFLSEEFPEFVTSGYNDAFVAQLDTWNVSVDPAAQKVNAPGDFAAGAGDTSPSTRPGRTRWTQHRLPARRTTARRWPWWPADGGPGSVHSLYLTMFDQGDPILDSAVFVDNIRFENLLAGQCKSLALDPYEATTGVTLAGTPASRRATPCSTSRSAATSRRARSAARSRRPPAS